MFLRGFLDTSELVLAAEDGFALRQRKILENQVFPNFVPRNVDEESFAELSDSEFATLVESLIRYRPRVGFETATFRHDLWRAFQQTSSR